MVNAYGHHLAITYFKLMCMYVEYPYMYNQRANIISLF